MLSTKWRIRCIKLYVKVLLTGINVYNKGWNGLRAKLFKVLLNEYCIAVVLCNRNI